MRRILRPSASLQLVRRADVARIGDSDQHDVVAEKPDRKRRVPARETLRQQAQSQRFDLRLGEVDVLELMLLGEGMRERAAGDPAVADDDLPETIAGLVLLGERLLQLLCRQELLPEQERAKLHADARAPERGGGQRLR